MKNLLSYYTTLSFLLLASQINADIVDSTCKGTPNYKLCVDILRKDPRSSTADIKGLALITVNALQAHTIETLGKIKNLRKSMPGLEVTLSGCKKNYDVVVNYDIPEAFEGLQKGNAKFAESGVADAAVEAELCEGSFGGSKSPLNEANKLEGEIANVARQIIRKLL
ncbi:hypothetical protein Leryth_011344 [Lithospermum erythrorhizon]|uniref:Pectinesterase inhibitor domain-containing protein n=1 Tax=Lithospermum erythrorhizon TaxID=34254 RepID=A0AAV3QR08_LITER|nr:hypothetical protein Leryth_011344 [Lithospermum erythrorhizon]